VATVSVVIGEASLGFHQKRVYSQPDPVTIKTELAGNKESRGRGMYTPLEVLIGSDGARRLAHSALPDAPVAAARARADRGRLRRRAGAVLRRTAELIDPEVVRRPADHCGGVRG
jgi:hypothetical protein